MAKHLPEWIMIRYAKLWLRFKENEFTMEQAKKVLKKDKALSVFLSEVRKSGWLEIRLDKDDARRTVYKLKNPNIAILEEIKELNKK